MKKSLIFGCSLLAMISCKNDQSNSEENITLDKVPPVETIDSHNTRNSIDWEGTYKGILPCADCSGIEITLTVDADGTYVLKRQYLDVDDQQNEFIEEGKFTWTEDGSKIKLEGIEDSPTKYFVGENYMLVLQQDGTKVTGELAEHYKLSKQ